VPTLRPTQSIGAVRLPLHEGRLSAGVALLVALVGTTVLTLSIALVAR
jgi:hypothetical protein